MLLVALWGSGDPEIVAQKNHDIKETVFWVDMIIYSEGEKNPNMQVGIEQTAQYRSLQSINRCKNA